MPLPEMVNRGYEGVSPMAQGDFVLLPKEKQDEIIAAFRRELVFLQEDAQQAVDFAAAVIERANVLGIPLDLSRLKISSGMQAPEPTPEPDALEPSAEQ